MTDRPRKFAHLHRNVMYTTTMPTDPSKLLVRCNGHEMHPDDGIEYPSLTVVAVLESARYRHYELNETFMLCNTGWRVELATLSYDSRVRQIMTVRRLIHYATVGRA